MKTKLLLALIFIVAPVVLESCCTDTHRFSAVPGALSLKVYNTANFQEQDTLAFEDFCIAPDFPEADVNLLTHAGKLSFGASAYATSCSEEFLLEPDVTTVSIVADRDYTAEYPAGTDLSPFFVSKHYLRRIANGEVSIDKYASADLVQLVRNILLYKGFGPSANEYTISYEVEKPTLPPSAPGTFVFTIAVTFKDGFTTTAQTPPVTLE